MRVPWFKQRNSDDSASKREALKALDESRKRLTEEQNKREAAERLAERMVAMRETNHFGEAWAWALRRGDSK